jgi:hypothetical protein
MSGVSSFGSGNLAKVGILCVDLSTFGVVMSATAKPIDALDGQMRVPAQQGRLTRCPIHAPSASRVRKTERARRTHRGDQRARFGSAATSVGAPEGAPHEHQCHH